MSDSNILWLITARSGSKSIPDKNIKDLGLLPLMAYKIKTALKISSEKHVWISTDSQKYADLGSSYGAYIPFLRPPHLSTDDASSVDVVLHAMEVAEQQLSKKEYIGLLEPTSPFIYPDLLQDALQKLSDDHNAEAIVAVREVRPNTIFVQDESKYLDSLAHNLETLKSTVRQKFSRQITPSGGFYISRWDAFRKNKTFYSTKTLPYSVFRECEIEIDEEMDWYFAEFLIEQKMVDLNRLI